MTTTTSFSAKDWLATNCLGANHLAPETVEVVANFALMWNFFEGAVCNNNANIRAFERIADRIALRTTPHEGIGEAIKFWTFRYWTGSEFRERFDGLNFRPNNRRDHVEAVLRGEKADPASQILAVLIIVYRLRNNLFHGLKTIDMLNDQVANLDMASRALASVLHASENRLVQGHTEPNQRFERDRSQAGGP